MTTTREPDRATTGKLSMAEVLETKHLKQVSIQYL